MNVADQAVVGPADAHVDDRGTRLHHVLGDQMRYSCSRDDDVGALDLGLEVGGTGVAEGDRGVLTATGQQQTDRPAMVTPRPTTVTRAPAIGTS